jgi:hypothetical protein
MDYHPCLPRLLIRKTVIESGIKRYRFKSRTDSAPFPWSLICPRQCNKPESDETLRLIKSTALHTKTVLIWTLRTGRNTTASSSRATVGHAAIHCTLYKTHHVHRSYITMCDIHHRTKWFQLSSVCGAAVDPKGASVSRAWCCMCFRGIRKWMVFNFTKLRMWSPHASCETSFGV